MWLSVTRSQVWMRSRCVQLVKFDVIALTLILVTGSTTWHLMAKNSEDLKKKKMYCSTSEVLNSSPRTPRSAYFACLSLLTHLIQIISLLEVRSMHELCSDWHAPYTGSIAPYSLSRGNPLKFTLFWNIHSWICTAQCLHARTSVTSYTSVNI